MFFIYNKCLFLTVLYAKKLNLKKSLKKQRNNKHKMKIKSDIKSPEGKIYYKKEQIKTNHDLNYSEFAKLKKLNRTYNKNTKKELIGYIQLICV